MSVQPPSSSSSRSKSSGNKKILHQKKVFVTFDPSGYVEKFQQQQKLKYDTDEIPLAPALEPRNHRSKKRYTAEGAVGEGESSFESSFSAGRNHRARCDKLSVKEVNAVRTAKA